MGEPMSEPCPPQFDIRDSQLRRKLLRPYTRCDCCDCHFDEVIEVPYAPERVLRICLECIVKCPEVVQERVAYAQWAYAAFSPFSKTRLRYPAEYQERDDELREDRYRSP